MNKPSFLCDVNDSVVVVLDIQEKLLAAMPEQTAVTLIKKANTLLSAATLLSIPTIVTEQYPKGLGHTVTRLTELLDQDSPIIAKTTFSAAKKADFCNCLTRSGCRQVILIGMESHICVLQTAFDLHQQGYYVFIVEDGISSRHENHHHLAVQRLSRGGISITCVESVLFEWLRDSKKKEFRAISQLII